MAAAQAPVLDDFVLFGSEALRARGLDVVSGDVGTNGTLIGSRRIDAEDSRIVGNRVELDRASSCEELLANTAESGPKCGPAKPVAIPVVANLASACGFPSPFPTQCSGPNVIVGHDGFAERGPGTYNVVDVAGGGQGPGTLVLAPGEYTFCSLRLGRNASLLAAGPVTINVIGSIKLDNGSQLRPQSGAIGPCDIQLFAGTNGKVRISRKAHVQAIVCAPNARLDITVGANLRGAFYAREVKSDRAILEVAICLPPTTTSTTTQPPASSTTTTSTTASTSSSSSTSTSTTTPQAVCGNEIVESGEQCDPPGSAGAAFCGPGGTCNAECQCEGGETTTSSSTTVPTTSSSSSSSSSTSTSTTTPAAVCGNEVVENGEQCDPPGSAGAAFCGPGGTCNAECQCEGGETTTSTSSSLPETTSSTSLLPTTTTTSSSSSTTTSTTSSSSTSSTLLATTSSTSTSVVPTTVAPTTSSSSTSTSTSTSTPPTTTGTPTAFDFLSTPGSGSCGNTYRTAAGTTPLKNLRCGSLSLGGGISQVPDNATPPGATNRFSLQCTGNDCAVGPIPSGQTPVGVECTDVGCRFGTPLPISNAGLSVCVTNTFSPTPPSGTLNIATGAATLNFQLNSATILTGNPSQPCPICAQSVGGAACSGTPDNPCIGVCDGSPNQGAACTSKNPVGLTLDCPAPAAVAGAGGQRCFRGDFNNNVCSTGSNCTNSACTGAGTPLPCCTGAGTGTCAAGLCAQFIGNIPISLNPLTTGTATLAGVIDNSQCTAAGQPQACCTGAGTGNCNVFCPGQGVVQKGAFRSDICNGGANSGQPCSANAQGQDPTVCGASIPCRLGTLTNYCVGGANDGLGCTSAATCPAPGACVRAGTIVQLVREVGIPAGALSIGIPKLITLGSAFCVAATTNPTVNSNANLPGPGATSVVGSVTLLSD